MWAERGRGQGGQGVRGAGGLVYKLVLLLNGAISSNYVPLQIQCGRYENEAVGESTHGH